MGHFFGQGESYIVVFPSFKLLELKAVVWSSSSPCLSAYGELPSRPGLTHPTL